MIAPEVVVVRTGVANLASVLAGLRRAGAMPRIGNEPRDIEQAGHLLLPGVGAFAAGMRQLTSDGLVEPLRARIAAGKPTLAICLGLQLLCAASEEDPGVQGLGLISGVVRRFPDSVRVPQMGWNSVEPDPNCRILQPGYAYFANSFRLTECPTGWQAAYAEHGGRFVAAIENGAVVGGQFHPELSGQWGLGLLQRWLGTSAGSGGASC